MKPSSVLLTILLLFLAGCGRHDSPVTLAATSTLPPVKVQVVTVRTQDVPQFTEVTGLVRPTQRAQIAAKVMGTIEDMPVALGQRVRAGDLLIKISAAEISARVTQAQSQLNAARRDLERERDLLEKGASTADMVRGLEDRFTAAQAMVHEAEAMLAYTSIRAPFDGVIARKPANVGDLASPGFPLLELEGTGGFEIEAGVPDSLALSLKPGAELHVEIPASGVHFSGRLTELSSAADPAALTVLAKIAVPTDILVRSGEFARVQVPGTPIATLLVPSTAVSRIGQIERVFVASADDRTTLRLVKTGAAREKDIEITAGLDANERIVVDPPVGLREGQPIEIRSGGL